MGVSIRELARRFEKALEEKLKPTGYDTVAEVLRIENDKAWVHIPGGVPETPIDIAGNISVGDRIEVRVDGGRAWVYGNYTDPPEGRKATRDTRKIASSAKKKANAAAEGVSQLVIITNQQEEEIGAVIITANGKNKTYHQATEPTGGEYAPGDIWFDTDDDNKMHRWNGTQWADVTLGDDALDSISADKITAGTIDASVVTVSNIDAGNITSGFLAAARIEAGSLSISKTDGLQTALDDASKVADDFITTISGQSGICVHDVEDFTNFLNVKSGEVGIYVGGTKVATYGATDASIGEGSATSSIGLCGDTFHLTGRQVTNAGLSGGVLCLDNDSTYTNKFMVVTTLTQSEEAEWFGTTSNIPNRDFGVMMVNKGSSDGGTFSVSTRKKNGKMANMSMMPTLFVLGLNGTVSGNTVTSDNTLSIDTSKMMYTKDFQAIGKLGTVYGYDNPVSTGINVHITNNGYLYRTTASSRKIKKEISDIKEGDLAPEKLYALPIRQFKYRKHQIGEEDMRYERFIPGFIAEEVAEVYPIAADLDDNGDPEDWNVRYVVPPMLALIQRQKQAIDSLNERIEMIEGRIM